MVIDLIKAEMRSAASLRANLPDWLGSANHAYSGSLPGSQIRSTRRWNES